MNSAEFCELLKLYGPKHVYDHYLLSPSAFIFNQIAPTRPIDAYHEFKTKVGAALDVPIQNIAIVGSAKVGFSMNPTKNFSEFSDKSDLDLVLVSSDLFRSLWNSFYSYVNSSTGCNYKDVAKNIFKHFISVKAEDLSGDQLKYFSSWVPKVDALRKSLQIEFSLPTEINYRVYEDWKFVEDYHVNGLKILEVKK